jgi:hypothetical protein
MQVQYKLTFNKSQNEKQTPPFSFPTALNEDSGLPNSNLMTSIHR